MIYYFIFGIIFGIALPPIIDQLTGLIITFLEVIKSKLNVIISKNNISIRQLEISSQEEHTFSVGFKLPPEEREEDWNDI